ncbi:MAG TPA: type IV toxin-antitoxin system AbiEi family antitoxin domain-containing protein [Solirubrobacterales bacterium]|nr:type IV toxin-antitoxin system AbiEi family antitoxin domain-containing protein [Solirubrobacterales bacterium]
MDGLEQTRGIDAAIAGLAVRQHGVVARRQLLAMGVGEEAIDWRLRHGRLHALHRGVYAVGHRAIMQEGRWMGAVLFCGDGAVLSHRSAAALWGIRGSSRRAIEVTSGSKARSRGGIHRHYAVLPDDEVTVERGIPVTTVPRTVFDLASTEGADVAENALRQSEYLRLHGRLSLPDLLARYPRRKGAKAVRAALVRRRETSGRMRSPLEERFLPFLRRHALPLPQLNAWLEVGGRRFQVDCLWPAQRQVVELDGWQAHGTRSAFRNDRTRDRHLRVAGYGITRLTWSQLDDEPTAIARDLGVLLDPQSHHRNHT